MAQANVLSANIHNVDTLTNELYALARADGQRISEKAAVAMIHLLSALIGRDTRKISGTSSNHKTIGYVCPLDSSMGDNQQQPRYSSCAVEC